MDLGDLHARDKARGVAHTGWSGCAPSQNMVDESAFEAIVRALPNRRSSDVQLHRQLSGIADQFQRFLRQDEFGPNRADQIAMLNRNLTILNDFPKIIRFLSSEKVDILCLDIGRSLEAKQYFDWSDLFNAIQGSASIEPLEIGPNLLRVCPERSCWIA